MGNGRAYLLSNHSGYRQEPPGAVTALEESTRASHVSKLSTVKGDLSPTGC